MSALTSFFSRLLGASQAFTPLEKRILDCVARELPLQYRDVWRAQVESVNKIQRLPGGVETDFYRMKGGRPDNSAVKSLPSATEEMALAKVRLTAKGTDKSISATVWCVNGFLFSIEYDGDSSYFAEGLGSEYLSTIGISCEILSDLSKFSTSAS
jgi:hypothetical protein